MQPLALVLVLAAGCFAPRTRAGTVDLPVRYGVTAVASSAPSLDGALLSAGVGALVESIARVGLDAVTRPDAGGVDVRRPALAGEVGVRVRALAMMAPRPELPRRVDFGLDGALGGRLDERSTAGLTSFGAIGLWASVGADWMGVDYPHVELQVRRHTSGAAVDGTDFLLTIGMTRRNPQRAR